jgi:hypothetical protein
MRVTDPGFKCMTRKAGATFPDMPYNGAKRRKTGTALNSRMKCQKKLSVLYGWIEYKQCQLEYKKERGGWILSAEVPNAKSVNAGWQRLLTAQNS